MLTATDAYRNAVTNLDRSLAVTAKAPIVARETANYLDNITKVKSIDDFMKNKRVLNYALSAHGLSDMSYASAFIRRLLEGGVDNQSSLANQMSDQRYRDFVTTFNFARYGTSTTAFDRTQKGTTDLYARQALEQNTGNVNEGARLALYFRRMAPALASPLGILANAALLKVVQTSTGLTPYMSNLDLDTQVQMISTKLDIADFKDPAKLDKFINRFTARWDVNNSTSSTAAQGLVGLSTTSSGFSPDLISAIQRVKARL